MHFPDKFLQKPPPTFSLVHLLYRFYGVDAPALQLVVSRHCSDPVCRPTQWLQLIISARDACATSATSVSHLFFICP